MPIDELERNAVTGKYACACDVSPALSSVHYPYSIN